MPLIKLIVFPQSARFWGSTSAIRKIDVQVLWADSIEIKARLAIPSSAFALSNRNAPKQFLG